MENTNLKFKSFFNDQIIKDIKFYNTKENYLALEEEKRWVIQGGVEFIFENHIITLGWNAEMHLYEMIEGDLDLLLGEMDVYDIELDTHEEFENLKGKRIDEVSFNWTWYQKLNDDLELTDEKVYIPQDVKITFEDETYLRISTILFSLREGQILNPVFDPQGNILVTLNNELEIQEAPINVEESDDHEL